MVTPFPMATVLVLNAPKINLNLYFMTIICPLFTYSSRSWSQYSMTQARFQDNCFISTTRPNLPIFGIVTCFDDRIKLEHFIKRFERDCVHAKSAAIISSLIPSEGRVRANFQPRKMILLLKLGQVNHSCKVWKQCPVKIWGN